MQNNDLKKYSKGTIAIHWISLFLIMALIPVGFIMADMEPSVNKIILYRLHFVIGWIVFALTLLRTWFFFKHPRPIPLKTGNNLNDKLIVWIKKLFYIILILISITGFATVIMGGLREATQTVNYTLLPISIDVPSALGHEILAKVLIALLVIHVLGVLRYYIKFRENILKRILPN